MSSEDDQLISIARQLAIKVDSNFVTLLESNFKAIILKLPGDFANKSLVWLKAIKLVNNGCLGRLRRNAGSFRTS